MGGEAQFGSAYTALNMKMLVVLALVAYVVAEPEAEAKADPWISYGGYGLGYSRLGYGLGYGGYGLGLGYSRGIIGYGKREAEAEPKADAEPWLTYGGYGLGYSRLGYGLGYGGLYGGYGGIYGYGKREAEAEPKAAADPWYYGGYGYSRLGLGYGGLGYSGLGYSGLYGGYRGIYGYGKREAEAEPKAAADPWYYGGYGYSGLGLGYGGY